MKKCHSIREALILLDFDDPSIADMRHMLLRAALAPAFLRGADGRRFLGFLFTLHPQMVSCSCSIYHYQTCNISSLSSLLSTWGLWSWGCADARYAAGVCL